MAGINFTPDASAAAPATPAISFTPDAAPETPEEEAFRMQNESEVGAGEAGASIVSGMGAQTLAGLGYGGQAIINAARSVGHAAAPGAVAAPTVDPLDVARGISERYTYQPRTEQGQAALGAVGAGMAAADRPIEAALDTIDPTGNLKETARNVAERANYIAAAVPAVAPFARVRVPEVPLETPRPAPVKTTPGPITPEQLRAQPDPLAPAPAAHPATPPTAPATAPPATAAEAAEQIRAEEGEMGTAGGPETNATNQPAPATPRFTPPDQEGTQHGALPPEEQDRRAGVLIKLNADSGNRLPEHRVSAITGDYAETGNDYQYAKGDDAGGKKIAATIAGENDALKAASDNASTRVGGIAQGTDQAALAERGQVIDRALGAIRDWFDTNITSMYGAADTQAAGRPIPHFTAVSEILGDPTNFAGTVEGDALYRGAIARAQRLGLVGDGGVWQPATVAQAEQFRRWLGDQYTPRTGRMIGQLKDALDADVTTHGGPGLYQQARALRLKRDQMLEGPTGISRLLANDRTGINRPVPIENIADNITNMPRDQFNHVVNVLKSSAHLGNGELAGDAAAALNEIRGHMAARLNEAGASARDGTWDPYKYYARLNAYSLKMPAVFSPEGIGRFKTLNDAGNILRMDKRYPGAGAQIQKLGGLSALARDRIAHTVEGAALGWLGPLKGAVAEATGLAPAIRGAVGRMLPGGGEAERAAALKARVMPLGAKIGGGKMRGAIGNLGQRDAIEHTSATNADGTIFHRYTVPNSGGSMNVVEYPDRGVRQVQTSNVANKGQGWGTQMLARAADEAHAKGQVLHSDDNVSQGQAGAYANLARLGYKITKRDADLRGGAYQAVGDHVFEVRPRQNVGTSAQAPTRPLAEMLPGQRGGPKFTSPQLTSGSIRAHRASPDSAS